MIASKQYANPAWYLIHCKAKQDERAEENLQRQGYHVIARLIDVNVSCGVNDKHSVSHCFLAICLSSSAGTTTGHHYAQREAY